MANLSQNDSELYKIGRELLELEHKFINKLIDFFEKQGNLETVKQLELADYYAQQPFTIVVVGEYNSGKSTLINALLEEKILEMGVTPTTDQIIIITTIPPVTEISGKEADNVWVKTIEVKNEVLKSTAIVDTPGTNSLIDNHQTVTENFIPRADLILFVSSSQQPLTASEREFLNIIYKKWHRKIIFILNKTDLMDTNEMEKVITYTEKNLREIFKEKLTVIPVSAKKALAEKLKHNATFQNSYLGSLETEIFERLDTSEKWVLKLKTPLISVKNLLDDVDSNLAATKQSLTLEIKGIHVIEQQSKDWINRIKQLVEAYLPAVEKPFNRFEKNCELFLDQKMTLASIFKMKLTRVSIEQEFKKEVFSDPVFENDFEAAIDGAAVFTLNEIQRFHREISAILEHHLTTYNQGKSRNVLDKLSTQREVVKRKMRKNEHLMELDFDAGKEAQRIKDSIYRSVYNFLGLEAFSGSVVAIAVSTAFSDFTGIALGAVMASLGFTIIPRKKAKLKKEFSERIHDIAENIQNSLRSKLHQEITDALNNFLAALSNYIILCQNELKQVTETSEEFAIYNNQLTELFKLIEKKILTRKKI